MERLRLGEPRRIRVHEQIGQCNELRIARQRLQRRNFAHVQVRNGVAEVVHRVRADVLAQLDFELVIRLMKRRVECLVDRLAARDQADVCAQLIAAFGMSDHQVMHQRPRLRVESSLPIELVILLRIVIDGDESFERDERLFVQEREALRDRQTDGDRVIARAECRVELRQSFVEPERHVR